MHLFIINTILSLLSIISSARSSYSHPDLLLTHLSSHQHKPTQKSSLATYMKAFSPLKHSWVAQLTCIWMSGASGLGNLTTEYLNFAKKSPLHCTMGQALLFMCFDPVFVFVGGMLRILWQWDPWWGQRPKTSETVPLFSPWDRVTHIFHTSYTKRGKTLEAHTTVKQTHVNWGKTGETWSL